MINRKLRALVGLSSSIMFNADVTENGCPNPILEGPVGLCLFYDEIIFFHELLCPLNMRELPYVSFVDMNELPDFDFGAIKITFPDKKVREFYNALENSEYFKVGKLTQFGPEIPVLGRTANAIEGINRVYDEVIASHMKCDLVVNSFSPIIDNLEIPDELYKSKGTLSSVLAQNIPYNLPNLQLPEGPCLYGVEKLRQSLNRNSFQDKIKAFDDCEVVYAQDEAVKYLIKEFDEWTLELQHQRTDPKRLYNILVDLIVGLIPGIGNIYTCLQSGWKVSKYEKDQEYCWAAFLGDWRALAKRS